MPPVARRSQFADSTGLAGFISGNPEQEVVTDDVAIDLTTEPLEPANDIIRETDDGGAVINLDPSSDLRADPNLAHDANLAEHIGSTNTTLAGELIEGYKADKQSRTEWEQAGVQGMKLLGFKFEDRNYPFKGACGVFDPLLSEALIRGQATIRAELWPAAGPTKTRVLGMGGQQSEDQAARVKLWMNTYATTYAPEYYPEVEQGLMWLLMWGNIWPYTYFDPLLGRRVTRRLTPDDFCVSYTTDSIYNTPRATVRSMPSKRDMKMLQLRGYYLNVDVGEPDETSNQSDTKQAVDREGGTQPIMAPQDDRYTVLNFFVDLDLEGFRHMHQGAASGLPLPYTVAVEEHSQKILSIRRNWRQIPNPAASQQQSGQPGMGHNGGPAMIDDPNYRRIMRIADLKFLPGFGYYGIGMAHTLGGYAKSATSLLRQLTDAGTLANFPGGVRVKGMRLENNKLMAGPCEFPEIDTGGLPIDQAIKPFPYKEPSVVLKDLRTEIVESARRLAGTQEIAVGEGRQDAPVGTTVALMEAATRVESGVVRRLHVGLTQELRHQAEVDGETLPETPYPFVVPGGQSTIMRADFSSMVDVIPVSDPNVTSSTQRIVRAEALKRSAMEAPQLHDMREVYFKFYTAMGIEDIEKILPPQQDAQPPPPMDPVSENQLALMQKPIKVYPWQDDDAHIAVHSVLAENSPQLMAHIAEHVGNKFRKLTELQLGQPLPPLGQPIPPQIEVQISMAAAQVMAQVHEQMQQAAATMDPKIAKIMSDDKHKTQDRQLQAAVKMDEMATKMSEADKKQMGENFREGAKLLDRAAERKSRERTTAVNALAAVSDNKTPVSPEVKNTIMQLAEGN